MDTRCPIVPTCSGASSWSARLGCATLYIHMPCVSRLFACMAHPSGDEGVGRAPRRDHVEHHHLGLQGDGGLAEGHGAPRRDAGAAAALIPWPSVRRRMGRLPTGFLPVVDGTDSEWWLDGQELDGIRPDTISFNAAIAACSRAGAVEEARGLLARMQQSGVRR